MGAKSRESPTASESRAGPCTSEVCAGPCMAASIAVCFVFVRERDPLGRILLGVVLVLALFAVCAGDRFGKQNFALVVLGDLSPTF